MDLLIVAEQPGQSGPYIKSACKAGWQIASEIDYRQLPGAVANVHADAAVLIAHQVNDVVLPLTSKSGGEI